MKVFDTDIVIKSVRSGQSVHNCKSESIRIFFTEMFKREISFN
jgi:hypothetical protein